MANEHSDARPQGPVRRIGEPMLLSTGTTLTRYLEVDRDVEWHCESDSARCWWRVVE